MSTSGEVVDVVNRIRVHAELLHDLGMKLGPIVMRDSADRVAALIDALEATPTDCDFANAEDYRDAVKSWWDTCAGPALAACRATQEPPA